MRKCKTPAVAQDNSYWHALDSSHVGCVCCEDGKRLLIMLSVFQAAMDRVVAAEEARRGWPEHLQLDEDGNPWTPGHQGIFQHTFSVCNANLTSFTGDGWACEMTVYGDGEHRDFGFADCHGREARPTYPSRQEAADAAWARFGSSTSPAVLA